MTIFNTQSINTGGLSYTADSTGNLILQSDGNIGLYLSNSISGLGVTITKNLTVGGAVAINGSLSVTGNLTFSDGSVQTAAASPYVLKNRIINGAMTIDQRNAGASVTAVDGQYTVDRFAAGVSQTGKLTWQQNAGSVTPPTGFTNYLGVTSTSAYSSLSTDYFFIIHRIEGFNIADLAWGTANAKTVTLSFWVRSSLTGTFGGALRNSATNRGYGFNYTISAANTWTQISVTITGDTSGTWLTTNGVGIEIDINLGTGSTYSVAAGTWTAGNYVSATGSQSIVGTNGATLYITGVQLEQNTSATPFERRLFNQELTNCQRYYIQSYPYGTVAGTNIGSSGAGTLEGVNYGATSFGYTIMGPFSFPVTMRTNASVTVYNNITGSSTASTCIRNVNASTNVAGYVLSASDKQVYISCDGVGVTTRAECAITASAEL
jgi:hypothetical protein